MDLLKLSKGSNYGIEINPSTHLNKQKHKYFYALNVTPKFILNLIVNMAE